MAAAPSTTTCLDANGADIAFAVTADSPQAAGGYMARQMLLLQHMYVTEHAPGQQEATESKVTIRYEVLNDHDSTKTFAPPDASPEDERIIKVPVLKAKEGGYYGFANECTAMMIWRKAQAQARVGAP